MFTCRERKGCPASFYLDSRCPNLQGHNCWENEEGCPLSKCEKNCSSCRAFYAQTKQNRQKDFLLKSVR